LTSIPDTYIAMPSPSKQPKQEDPDFDELMSDDEQDEDTDYQEVDEETGFTISDPLKRPITSPMSCYDIYTQIQEGLISLEADYQRDVVWNDAKQSGLIDSVYRDYFIPPVLFAVHEIDGEDVKICIDGKQRLTSIQRFMDGHIPFKSARSSDRKAYTRRLQETICCETATVRRIPRFVRRDGARYLSARTTRHGAQRG